ncbi:MAG TPA: signal peptidase II [Anaerolineaceae bacterium]|nr:signal peptidase II [Anaerolineaceae bacterium]
MKKLLRTYLLLIIVAIVVIGLDQFTKSIIRANFALWTDVWAPWDWMLPYARIVHVPNTGVAFGMFQGSGHIFSIVNIIVVLIILFYYPRVPQSDWSLRLAMSMQMSGAIGNLIDRLTIGHVTDFISVGNFPVFNIADASITCGVGVLIVGVWLSDREEKKKNAQDQNNESELEPGIPEEV